MSAVEDPAASAAGAEIFGLAGQLGADLAAVDWAATPLGPPAGWPQSLRTAVSILLSSRFPMWMAWGPQLTFFCNDAYRRDTLGRKYPWALGRPASEVWAEIWDDIGPRIRTVLTTGTATWDEALLLFLERSGYREETYHTFSYSPLRDDEHALVGMLCVVSEDTERVIGERRMATLRDLGSDPSVARTEQETLAFVEQQLGRNLTDLPFVLIYLFEEGGPPRLAAATGTPDFLDRAGDIWPAEALAQQESVVVALPPGAPAGAWPDPPAQALLVPLVRQGGAPHGFLVAALNPYRLLDEGYRGFLKLIAAQIAAGVAGARSYQTQQRRAEELAELDRAKTVFFANISHEFRTPLTLIMGPVQELRARLPETDTAVRDEVEIIHRNSLRLAKLVNALLDFSRIEAGRMQARYAPVDLSLFTTELASVFRAAIERAGLVLEVDCPPLEQPVYVDREMWEKVILNLLSNALKFTFAGTVRVSLSADREGAIVRISDTGIGISAEEMPRLFERFHRIPAARSRSHEGSGIGLALVRELVHLHGGSIDVESEPGAGTTFAIRLRFGAAHLPAEQIVAATDGAATTETAEPFVHEALRWLPEGPGANAELAATRPTGRPAARVLVADDNADMRDYLQRLLTGQYDVTAVTDGAAALSIARRTPPDLVVSDVMMPGLDGIGLVGALRAEPRTANVPILLLSARAGQEAAVEGLTAGADDYLVKPFAAQELLARVRANLDLARLRNHHAQWRTAMIDSLQEGFFVADGGGTIVETNSAFSDLLGYPQDGVPYPPPHPWWPDPQADPTAYQQVIEAFGQVTAGQHANIVLPLQHQDGHRLWAAVSINSVADDQGTPMMVGTLRDVTAERYAAHRDTALNAMNERLATARTVSEVLEAAVGLLRELWHATAVFARSGTTSAASADGGGAPPAAMDALGDVPPLRLLVESGSRGGPSGLGTTVDSPLGPIRIWLSLDPARGFGVEDQTLLLLLCGSLAQALHRAYAFDQQREVALALQRAILGPVALPAGFAVRYEPATPPLEVGGDWYDAVTLPDGRIGIMVGDCVGRGLAAATVMGQLRSAGHALLLQASGPAEVLAALDRFAAPLPGARCTTAFCGILDPDTGHLVYSSAGHPPAIITRADGRTELLEGGRGTPLGVRIGRERAEARTTVPARAVLLVYTDGLVERRGSSLDAGISEAAGAVRANRALPTEELADRVMTWMTDDGGSDDVALLVYRHPVPLTLHFDADSRELKTARAALRVWLDRAGATPEVAQDVLIAAGEACANAVEHAYRDSNQDIQGDVRLTAVAVGDDVRITVSDRGIWNIGRPEGSPFRGRGRSLMRTLMREVRFLTGADGTTVEMSTRITG